jgi:pimeloyl-ACP methyl ester carboxylesterase
VPFATLPESPLAGRAPDPQRPVRIFYRQYGAGFPLVFLHGGWGYNIYPFGRQIDALGRDFGILIPDRSGYGRSGPIDALPADFHHRAAAETLTLLDALGIEKAALWGHSDGSVIATLLGLQHPERFPALILEAFHFYRAKPVTSQKFFEDALRDPMTISERVAAGLAAEHGDPYWRQLTRMGSQAWLDLAAEDRPTPDLYQGRLAELQMPVLWLHGARDPRTEPGEMAAVARELPPAGQIHILENGGHSPHSEAATAEETSRLAVAFLAKVPTWVKG